MLTVEPQLLWNSGPRSMHTSARAEDPLENHGSSKTSLKYCTKNCLLILQRLEQHWERSQEHRGTDRYRQSGEFNRRQPRCGVKVELTGAWRSVWQATWTDSVCCLHYGLGNWIWNGKRKQVVMFCSLSGEPGHVTEQVFQYSSAGGGGMPRKGRLERCRARDALQQGWVSAHSKQDWGPQRW